MFKHKKENTEWRLLLFLRAELLEAGIDREWQKAWAQEITLTTSLIK